jgi:hypothetical protein
MPSGSKTEDSKTEDSKTDDSKADDSKIENSSRGSSSSKEPPRGTRPGVAQRSGVSTQLSPKARAHLGATGPNSSALSYPADASGSNSAGEQPEQMLQQTSAYGPGYQTCQRYGWPYGLKASRIQVGIRPAKEVAKAVFGRIGRIVG